MNERRCPRCNRVKALSEFSPDKSRKNGVSAWCRSCRGSYKRLYDLKHPNSRKASNLRIKYGITLEEYEVMFKAQGGVCAVCGQSETTRYRGTLRSLAVDHNHVTGRVRGLLCGNCNKALGLLKDNPVIIEGLANYTRRCGD